MHLLVTDVTVLAADAETATFKPLKMGRNTNIRCKSRFIASIPLFEGYYPTTLSITFLVSPLYLCPFLTGAL
jgi:hypothetical protein